MAFQNANLSLGLQANNAYQVGVSNVDSGLVIEDGVILPNSTFLEASWLYFECFVGSMLDSGIVVHNRLPQIDRTYDTLATVSLDDPLLEKAVGGVNLQSQDQYTDIIQRMGHSRYWFRLWGRAMRVGKQIPIPGLKTIGGVPAIPYDRNPQWAYNSIVSGGNFSGTILWRAAWSLWYTTAVPPVDQVVPAADPAAHISGVTPQAKSIQAPFSQADDNAVSSAPNLGVAR